ncbi:MAG: hypothetical protein LAT56_00310 [Wenzhouxiangella sp.]|nr:hypothetical protein [Wenzhouxiangella sp.]
MPDRARAIINQALLRLSENTVEDLETTTQESALMAKQMLPIVMDEATAEWEWSFATVTQELAPADGVAEAPEDMIRVLSISPPTATWRMVGRDIETNESEPSLTYIRSLVEYDEESGDPVVDAWVTPKFQIAVACRLASEIAGKVTGNMQLASQLMQEYMVLVRQARSQDSLGAEGPDDEPEDWRKIT